MARKINGYINHEEIGDYQFLNGNTAKILPSLNKKFDLIITSPAYNLNKSYETKTSIENYLHKQKEVIEQLVEKLNDNGSICWQVGNYINDRTNEMFPLDIFYYDIFKELGLKLKNRIIWHFGHGLHARTKFSGRYETILWFVKGDNYIFNLDEIRIPQKYPGKKAYKGQNKGEYSGNPLGKNPSDVWNIVKTDWDEGIWDIPNVKANHKEKTIHPCQFPIELAERCILALTNPGSWVLDPYCGVGSSIIASIKNNRNAIGIDKDKKYLQIGKKRVSDLKNNQLKYRKIGTKILDPNTLNSAVAKKPEHFKY